MYYVVQSILFCQLDFRSRGLRSIIQANDLYLYENMKRTKNNTGIFNARIIGCVQSYKSVV